MTGVPVIGVLPWLEHGLPDEDGAAQRNGAGRRVAVIRYPTASNLDEFRRLEQVARVEWITGPGELDGADLVVLPGSKHVAADLAWLRRTGLSESVAARASDGGLVVGICGGLQMLGERLDDSAGVDGSARGLGLLPVATTFEAEKLTGPVEVQLGELSQPWQALSRLAFTGYEIRHGRIEPPETVFAEGPVLGLTAHGLFESEDVVRALFGRGFGRSLAAVFDDLADAVEQHLDTDLLFELAGVG
jgi:adenosylcobyric acid synthase